MVSGLVWNLHDLSLSLSQHEGKELFLSPFTALQGPPLAFWFNWDDSELGAGRGEGVGGGRLGTREQKQGQPRKHLGVYGLHPPSLPSPTITPIPGLCRSLWVVCVPWLRTTVVEKGEKLGENHLFRSQGQISIAKNSQKINVCRETGNYMSDGLSAAKIRRGKKCQYLGQGVGGRETVEIKILLLHILALSYFFLTWFFLNFLSLQFFCPYSSGLAWIKI